MAPRKRDYAAEYARRQARARSLGFSSYYERRTRPSPGAPKPPSEELARARGHRGFQDLVRSLGRDDLVAVEPGSPRNSLGQWERIEITVIDGDNGRERNYSLSDVDIAMIEALLAAMDEAESDDSPGYGVANLYGG